jgi:fucose 4-O-acetylase-like acetyltransferase
MATSTLQQRTSELDGIKGLMIVLMVFGHVTFSGYLQPLLQQATDVMHTFRMPLFLILCGYFFSPQRPTNELSRRAIRGLLIPYFIFEATYLVLLMGAQAYGVQTNNSIEPSLSVLMKTLFVNPIGAYWFLHTLALFQLSTAVAVFAARKMKTDAWLAILIVLLLGLNSLKLIALDSIEFLMIGLLLKQFRVVLPGSMLAGIAVIVLMQLVYGPPLDTSGTKPNAMLHGIWVVAILSLINGFFRRFPNAPTLPLWRYLGQNTLIILLAHVFFINMVKPLSGHILAIDGSGLLYAAAVTAAGVAGPLFLAKLLDAISLSRPLFDKNRIYIGWRESQNKLTDSGPIGTTRPETVLQQPAKGI